MRVKNESEVAQSCPTLRDPMDCVAYQAPPSMGFSSKSTGVGCHRLLQELWLQGYIATTKSTGYIVTWASLLTQSVKNLPAMQETRVWSLGWENPLEKEMATHSSILSWRILWTEEPGGLQSMWLQELDTRVELSAFPEHVPKWVSVQKSSGQN